MVKKSILLMLLFVQSIVIFAQSSQVTNGADTPFNARIYNKEYDVFIQMNLYEESIKIPGQDILGTVYGYLKKPSDSRIWAIMDVKISKDGKKANIDLINDYGSEDLTAELIVNKNGTYLLRQLEGSTIKVAGKTKWIKLPKELTFTR